ncbi:MAG: DUF4382 domain-containing protein [Thermotogota bacterium]
MSRKLVFFVFAIVLSVFLVSCTGLTGDNEETSRVGVFLTDKPISGLEEFFVDINAVTINYETPDGTDSTTNLVERNIDLLTLAATETELFDFEINPEATIESIKVNIGNPATATINGNSEPVYVMGMGTSPSRDINIAGVSINVGENGKDLIIDFDVSESIIYVPGMDEYKMKPVLKLNHRERNQERKHFYGEISGDSQWFLRLTENDTALATTMTNSSGEFRFGRVEDGNYILNIYNPNNIEFKESENSTITLPDTPTATESITVPDDNGIEITIE